MRYSFIAIEGNIGAGKTTLASRLASYYNAQLVLEEFEDNPFLPKFYKDPKKYALALELSFIEARFKQLREALSRKDRLIISDYFFNKSLVFARANLQGSELDIFTGSYTLMEWQLPRPDLLVFLYPNTEKLQENIRKRGREYEKDIPSDYLQRIQQGYLDYLEHQKEVPVLFLDLQSTRYIQSLEDFAYLDRLLNKEHKTGVTRVAV